MGRDMQRKIIARVLQVALCSLVLGAIIMAIIVRNSFRCRPAMPEAEPPEITVTSLELPVEPIHAKPLVYVTPETVEPVALLDEVTEPEVHIIENCAVTYYCAERYPHICGTGDGITATGVAVTPGVTCAVDPSVIPYGSIVTVDYGDGVLHEYVAQDSGVWVNEDHIDICVDKHDTALEMGRRTATVYWEAGHGQITEK